MLNEPGEAESICLDILETDPENQPALITLLLALTDRFSKGYGVSDTQANHCSRGSRANTSAPTTRGFWPSAGPRRNSRRDTPGPVITPTMIVRSDAAVREGRNVRPPGNDDALLRWNTCARMMAKNKLAARDEDRTEPVLEYGAARRISCPFVEFRSTSFRG